MLFDTCYQNTINERCELLVWTNGFITISEMEDMSLREFKSYRTTFKEKYEKDNENKQKFIENTFEFARKGIEVICKTIAGAFGTKTDQSSLDKYKQK